MILIGQYDSPFVRRVGIALVLYGIPFEHRPWSVFGDGEKVAAHNPLVRVPTLVLDEGEALIESHLILDHLDSRVPEARRMFPVAEPARRRALKVAALACGTAELGVSLFYEQRLHRQASDVLVARRRGQIAAGLAALESDCKTRTGAYWHGDAIGHADVAVAAALRFLSEAHPGLVTKASLPALAAFSTRLETLPVLQQISQPFIAPA